MALSRFVRARRRLIGVGCGMLASLILASALHADEPATGQATADAVDRAALPGTIYVHASWNTTDDQGAVAQHYGTMAIDPNTGTFRDLGALGHSIRVSPDGKYIAASRDGEKVDGHKTNDVHVVDTTNFETLYIAENASRPVWSGDSKHLIYNVGKMGGDNGEDVGWRGQGRSVDVTTKEVRPLDVPKTDEIDDCSADGKWLVTVSDRHPPLGSGYQLYAMHLDGSAQTRLTVGPGLNCYPRFCPTSNRVAYHFSRKGVGILRVVDLDGKNQRDLLKSEDGIGSPEAAAWSPDGKWLVVVRFDWSRDAKGELTLGDPAEANYRLEIIDAEGNSRGPLPLANVSKTVWLGHPDWR